MNHHKCLWRFPQLMIQLEYQAEKIKSIFEIDIEIYGFDNKDGLPPPEDYKDIPYQKIKHNNEDDFNIFLCTYKTIKNVTQAIDDFHFNIAIANIRTLFNELNLYKTETISNKIIKKFCISNFLILLNPICPHISEEAWEILGNKNSISNSPWPKVDLKYLDENHVILPIQINGKRRGEIKISKSLQNKEVESLALNHKNIVKFFLT